MPKLPVPSNVRFQVSPEPVSVSDLVFVYCFIGFISLILSYILYCHRQTARGYIALRDNDRVPTFRRLSFETLRNEGDLESTLR